MFATPAPGADQPTEPVGGLALLAFYLVGFLGPFGTLVITPMLPDLRREFDVDSAAISWGVSAYLFPMAILMLGSGTVGERLGRSRTLRISLLVYLAASILVTLSPNLALFLTARALQGAGNAFFTPLVLAGLADLTPRNQLSLRLGVYGSFQAVGAASAPTVGGAAVALDWRLAYFATAVVTVVVLVTAPRHMGDRGSTADGSVADHVSPIRSLLTIPVAALVLASFIANAGPFGAQVLLSLKLQDLLNINASRAGLILAAGFVGPIVLGPLIGVVVERFGSRPSGILAVVAVAVTVGLLGPVDRTIAVTLLWLSAGTFLGLVTVVLHRTAAVIVPENRSGGLSLVLAFRFFGLAVSPLVWVPVFDRSVRWAFGGAGLLGLVAVVGLVLAVPARPGERAEDIAGRPEGRV